MSNFLHNVSSGKLGYRWNSMVDHQCDASLFGSPSPPCHHFSPLYPSMSCQSYLSCNSRIFLSLLKKYTICIYIVSRNLAICNPGRQCQNTFVFHPSLHWLALLWTTCLFTRLESPLIRWENQGRIFLHCFQKNKRGDKFIPRSHRLPILPQHSLKTV